MPFKKGLANTTSYIEKYINTAYDEVKTVYDNLASIIALAAQDAAITEIASVGDLSALEANMTAFLASPHIGMKDPVVGASTANVALTGLQTIDGVALTAGMRFLAKNQTDPIENGIYLIVDGAAWTRASDWDNVVNVTDVSEGTTVPVTRGTVNALTYWTVSTTAAIVVGTTAVTIIAGLTNIGIAATTTVIDDVIDTTSFPVFMNEATGDNAMKSDAAKLKYNAATGQLDASIINTSGNAEIGGDANITGNSSMVDLTATGNAAITGNAVVTGQVRQNLGSNIDNTNVDFNGIVTLPNDGNFFNVTKADVIVTSITNANPGVVTAVGHGFIQSSNVFFEHVEGMLELNGNSYNIGYIDADRFSITNTTAFGAFSNDGRATAMRHIVRLTDANMFGLTVKLYFEGKVHLQNVESWLDLGGLDIVTRAGDIIEFVQTANLQWRMVHAPKQQFGLFEPYVAGTATYGGANRCSWTLDGNLLFIEGSVHILLIGTGATGTIFFDFGPDPLPWKNIVNGSIHVYAWQSLAIPVMTLGAAWDGISLIWQGVTAAATSTTGLNVMGDATTIYFSGVGHVERII